MSAPFQLNASIGYDDNLNNAAYADEKIGSSWWSIAGGGRWVPWEASRMGVSVATRLVRQQILEPQGLSSTKLSLTPEMWWMPWSGFSAPTLRFQINATVNEFDSRLRDGHEARAQLLIISRLTSNINLQLHAATQRRWAEAVYFEGRRSSWGLGLMWRPTLRWRLFATYDWQRGDIAASVPANNSSLFDSGLPWIDDDALPGNWVYRLDADSSMATLGLNWQLHPVWSLSLQAQAIDNQAAYYSGSRAGAYRRTRASAGLNIHF
ncbi:MAG: hypothetical protein ACSHXK_02275 [Oceanococcus sp.]